MPTPLPYELSDKVRQDEARIWQQNIDGLRDLPKAKISPAVDPYNAADPFSWLRNACENFREDMSLSDELIDFYLELGPEFDKEFSNWGSIESLHSAAIQAPVLRIQQWATAELAIDKALRRVDSLMEITKEKDKTARLQKEKESLEKAKNELLQSQPEPKNLVLNSEYAPRRPFKRFKATDNQIEFYGRVLNVPNGVVVVVDNAVSDSRDQKETLLGVQHAISGSGDGVALGITVVGSSIRKWPKEGIASLTTDKKETLGNWIEEQKDGGRDTNSKEMLQKAIDEAVAMKNNEGEPPSAILVVGQLADLSKLDQASVKADIPIHTFAMRRSSGDEWRTLVEKFRAISHNSKGQFTVVSRDWIWLYLEEPK